MIFDTTFIIDVLDGDDGALDFLEGTERERRPETVATTTVLELPEGVRRSNHPESEQERVLDTKHVVADHDVMRRAGDLSGRLFAAGTPVDRGGCIVAAVALSEDEPVVTCVDDFERIEGLDVRAY